MRHYPPMQWIGPAGKVLVVRDRRGAGSATDRPYVSLHMWRSETKPIALEVGGLVLGGAPAPVLAEGHRAQRRLGDAQAAVAQESISHDCTFVRGDAVRAARSRRLAHGAEGRAQLSGEKLRLFPCREVAALV